MDAMKDEKDGPTEEVESPEGLEEAGATMGDPAPSMGEATEESEGADELLDKLQRLRADYQNFRRQSEKRLADQRRFVAKEHFAALLPVVDNFGAAMASLDANQDPKNVLIGVKMIHEMLEKLLVDSGVSILKAEGEPFDPSLHEAVGREETEDTEPNVVLREVQRGYRMGDLVIRPSRVVVAAAPTTAANDEEEN